MSARKDGKAKTSQRLRLRFNRSQLEKERESWSANDIGPDDQDKRLLVAELKQGLLTKDRLALLDPEMFIGFPDLRDAIIEAQSAENGA